jgi:hypothetical protein
MRAVIERIRPGGPDGAAEVAILVEDEEDAVRLVRRAEIVVHVAGATQMTIEQIRSRAFVQTILFLTEAARLREV